MIKLDWFPVVDKVSTFASIPLATIGFGIAFWQINKTKKAAEAARDAAQESAIDVSRSNIVAIISELHRIETEIERAVETRSLPLFFSWSNTWRRQAGRLTGYITFINPDENKITVLLQESIAFAAIVKDQLTTREPNDLIRATRNVRAAIANVTNELGALEAVYGLSKKGDVSAFGRTATQVGKAPKPTNRGDSRTGGELEAPEP